MDFTTTTRHKVARKHDNTRVATGRSPALPKRIFEQRGMSFGVQCNKVGGGSTATQHFASFNNKGCMVTFHVLRMP
ncbi:hypothetical protein BST61_g3861 [Cercospora zeina]